MITAKFAIKIQSNVSAITCNYQQDGTLDKINNMVAEMNFVAFLAAGKKMDDYAYFLHRCLKTSTTTNNCHGISKEFPGICLEISCGRSDDATAKEFDGFQKWFWQKGSNQFKVKLFLRQGHFEGADEISFKIEMREKMSPSNKTECDPISVTKETYAKCSEVSTTMTTNRRHHRLYLDSVSH